ncbi:uncharacterized protein LOC142235260 [Haematobia irritans]|uniref:uncharacterized protein LOC142235260 n=1 Tax=Haematobia irritans TaxID=7368 RepID=UPI003F4F7294
MLVKQGGNHPVSMLISDFNKEYRMEINIIVDLKIDSNFEFNEIVAKIEKPKLLIKSYQIEMRPLHELFNMQSLTIARIDEETFNTTLAVMKTLLWRRHFTHIIIWYDDSNDDLQQLKELFQRSWQLGYSYMVAWWQDNLYTFKPYPKIKIIRVENFHHWKIQSILDNFQQNSIGIVGLDMPPRCFSYYNRRGQLIRTGYLYKLIENFIKHYNGSIFYALFDNWSYADNSYDADVINRYRDYSFLAAHSTPRNLIDIPRSDPIGFGNLLLIVPTSREINQSSYILRSFRREMWLVITSLLVTFAVIIYLISMYSLRIYQPELDTLKDIERNNLKILIHTTDTEYYRSVENLPHTIFDRIITGNNMDLYVYRSQLNATYIYTAIEDVANYLLFQQKYLKRPITKSISEPFFSVPITIALAPGMPLTDRFNSYLGIMKQSGILNKFIADSQLDGILSGNIKFFRDNDTTRPLILDNFFIEIFICLCFISWPLCGVNRC